MQPKIQHQGSPSSLSPEAFIAKWQGKDGSERANYQLFITELCELLGVPKPEAAQHDSTENAYTFERHVKMSQGDGTEADRYLDFYRRGAFVLEAKKVRAGAHTKGFGEAMLKARAQAETYARALPASEGRPPFLIVADVGHVIELYAEFTRSGANYTPFPDPRSHRIKLADLQDAKVRERLRLVWLDPLALDPSRISAEVTRDVAAHLAELARSLEASGHASEQVSAFLTRALFCMFAEDVALLPKDSFRGLLEKHANAPDTLVQMLRMLWKDMDSGDFSAVLAQRVLRFNGKIFKGHAQEGYVLPLTKLQIHTLLQAAKADWKSVEPAIFGTLLERALNPEERHALGAHYTPRAYVERLVLPTVIEPLRQQWADTQAAALLLAREAEEMLHPLDAKGQPKAPTRKAELAADKLIKQARAEVKRFHHHLCTLRVLDPACGSGNFLYVTLEHLKRLEGEVLNQLADLGETQDKLGLEGETVTPKQFLGIELNRRAAALAELVLWIGHLQWHIRTQGNASVAEPVVHDFGNIENRDAVLAFDGQEPAFDAQGQLLSRWDGKTFKPHPVTGEQVPDEAAQEPQWRYLNPRAATWPQADYIVGNPPFIGASTMRATLGDGYVQALREAWPSVPESADFVMYWWDQAARTVRQGQSQQFGLITTNSLRQTFNRRVISAHLDDAKAPLSLSFAVPDHPWVDSAAGAAVRIAMSVGAPGDLEGRLLTVTKETQGEHDEVAVTLEERQGKVFADLRIGANVGGAKQLTANGELSNRGVQLFGAGFIVTRDEARALGLGNEPGLERVIREYRNGRDLTANSRDVMVIDAFGLKAEALRAKHPAAYQWLLTKVKPERDTNNRDTYRVNWWFFGEPRRTLRSQLRGLPRYIATVETTKHRTFQFLDESILPDNMLVAIAVNDACALGVLSSIVHGEWALAAGGTLEDRPRYNKTVCFETFPFPADDTGFSPTSPLADTIRRHAEAIDAHRKRVLASPEGVAAGLTLTGIYNVLEALRAGRALSAKEKLHHSTGLVGVLQSLHDELDAAVLQAYGWQDLGAVPWGETEPQSAARQAWVEALLERLVALNARRAADEARGLVRWLRPEFQDPAQRALLSSPAETAEANVGAPAAMSDTTGDTNTLAPEADDEAEASVPAKAVSAATRRPWPTELPEQMRATFEVLSTSPIALSEAQLAEHFKGQGPWKKRLPQILDTLEALGRARKGAGAAEGEVAWSRA
jgi:type I restriction-modification system DNA methylase subunit